VRLVKHWNKMPGKAIDASSLETFKARLDRALSNLVHFNTSLFTAGGLG